MKIDLYSFRYGQSTLCQEIVNLIDAGQTSEGVRQFLVARYDGVTDRMEAQ